MNLPKAGIPSNDLSSYLRQGKEQQMLFMGLENDVEVPEHFHESQWGAVLSGEIELTVEGRKNTFKMGDTYFILAGAKHSAKVKAGYRDITLFNQKDRYPAK